MSAGGVCALAPGEVHDCTDLTEVEGWLVLFCADALSERTFDGPWRADPRWAAFRRAGADGRLWLSSGDPDRLVSGLDGLRQALDRPQVGHALAVGAWLDLILLELAGHLADRAGGDLTAPTHDPMVAEVLGIIDRDFAASVSLALIAREVRRSPSHLTDRVRRVTGLTVSQWIIERRLAEARGLLSHTDLTVAEVAECVGYVDLRHFTRHFGRAYGRAPAAWRRASRGPGHPPS